ncbi:hypothetical protein [Streptomyces sp. NPDC052107]|uniref:hypothetical protein n=1 Tax=Streptomyces sp. NPDC052107 TaxID=3155632 RepID=UPI003413737B
MGGAPRVLDLVRALRAAGLDVLMWAGAAQERMRIEAAGIELAAGELMAAASDPQARLEGVTSPHLLTDDDFNALAAIVMEDSVEGPVHRVGPPPDSEGVVARYTAGGTVFGPELVRHVPATRHARGARFHLRTASEPRPPGHDALFVVRRDGRLEPVTGDRPVAARQGDTLVLLGPGRPEG